MLAYLKVVQIIAEWSEGERHFHSDMHVNVAWNSTQQIQVLLTRRTENVLRRMISFTTLVSLHCRSAAKSLITWSLVLPRGGVRVPMVVNMGGIWRVGGKESPSTQCTIGQCHFWIQSHQPCGKSQCYAVGKSVYYLNMTKAGVNWSWAIPFNDHTERWSYLWRLASIFIISRGIY